MRVCKYCRELKPDSDFPKHKQNKDRLDNRCRSCIRKRNKIVMNLRETAPAKPENGMCQACFKIHPKGLVLDHDPITNEFRGWICQPCNMGLGCLGDTLEDVQKMVRYLNSHPWKGWPPFGNSI